MNGGFFCNIIVREGPTVLKLLPCKDEALLIGGYALFVLDLLLNSFDRIGRIDFKCDSFPRQCFHEYLHDGCA